MMVSQKKTILSRLMNLETQNFERNNALCTITKNETTSPLAEKVATPLKPVTIPCKTTLKRNIFANTIINKNATKLMNGEQPNNNEKVNILKNEPINEMMITDFERKIYDQLDQLGVRLADPMEIQNDFYQKIRSSIISHDDINSDRFLTPKIAALSERDLDTRASSQVITSSDLDQIDMSRSADLKFLDSKIYLKRSTFKRPAILEQYTKSKTTE